MMPLFRKKPVIVAAIQYEGSVESAIAIAKEFELEDAWVEMNTEVGQPPPKFKIKTLEGVMCADKWDWIIKGVKGECYPCKPDIFEATYEPVMVTCHLCNLKYASGTAHYCPGYRW